MRFLKDVKIELDEKGEKLLLYRVGRFLRAGNRFTLEEWQSLSEQEQDAAIAVRGALRLEELLQLRQVLRAETPEEAGQILAGAGLEEAADHLKLKQAVDQIATGMNTPAFAEGTKQ